MQMAICIIGGAVVADAPVAKRAINRVASLPQNGPQAAFLVAAVTILLSDVQFGLSLAGAARCSPRASRATSAAAASPANTACWSPAPTSGR